MKLNSNITKKEAAWLVNEYEPKSTLRVDGHTMDTIFLPARRIMSGNYEMNKPSCGCEFKVFAQVTNSIYNQFQGEIKAKLVVKKKASGRNKRKKV